MTPLAHRAQLLPVHVFMARRAILGGACKSQRRVALPTGHLHMPPVSGKPVVLWSNRIADADTFHESVLWQASHETDKAP